MDKGMGKSAIPPVGKPEDFEAARRAVSQPVSGSASQPASRIATPPAPRPAPQPAAKPTRQFLEGYVKGGVVHLLEGELPDGIFVKIIRE
jgi:probable phosphoglycerate mutase